MEEPRSKTHGTRDTGRDSFNTEIKYDPIFTLILKLYDYDSIMALVIGATVTP